VKVKPLRLLAVMYACRKVAEESEQLLSGLRIGMSAEYLSRDLERTLEILDERLAEMRKP
jgi:hypothetical protein